MFDAARNAVREFAAVKGQAALVHEAIGIPMALVALAGILLALAVALEG